jgi:short-subunit dehydrogenase
MKSFINKNVLITGASSGIGEALAYEFASQGANLILLARRKEKIETIARGILRKYPERKVLELQADVCSDESVRRAVAESFSAFGTIDVVVANAGFGVAGQVQELSLDDYRRQFETNIFGVLRIVKETFPYLSQTQGRLAIVGSVNGYISLPGISAYAMSKFSIRALCDALYHEFRPAGISVTHIAPGFVVSEIRRVNNRGELRSQAQDPIPMWLQMTASLAAKKIVRAIYQRKRERVVTGHGWWAVRLYRFFPELVFLLVGIFKIKARPEPRS